MKTFTIFLIVLNSISVIHALVQDDVFQASVSMLIAIFLMINLDVWDEQ